jgi:hypothetical protein
MSNQKTPIMDDLAKLFEAAWIELPTAAVRRLTAGDDKGAARDAGWKAYDALVRISNEASNALYTNRAFGEVAGRGIGLALRMQRVGDAVASAVFGNLWPAIGLPTGSEIQALRSDVRALSGDVESLREEVRSANIQDGERNEARERIEDRATIDRGYAAVRSAESQSATPAMVWNGFKPAAPRKSRGRKNSVAL